MANLNLSSFQKTLLLILIFITTTTSLFAQLREDLSNEILVYIQSSELEFPETEQKSIPLANITIFNSELRTVLVRFGVRELQKAF